MTVGLEERSVFRPCREERYFNGELLAEREIKEFDQYGNPLHIVATGQPETCYVWRYRECIRWPRYEAPLTSRWRRP